MAAFIASLGAKAARDSAERASAEPARAATKAMVIEAVTNSQLIPGRARAPPGGYGGLRRRQQAHHRRCAERNSERARGRAAEALAGTKLFMGTVWWVADAVLKEVGPVVRRLEERRQKELKDVERKITEQLGPSGPAADVGAKVDAARERAKAKVKWDGMYSRRRARFRKQQQEKNVASREHGQGGPTAAGRVDGGVGA